MTFPSVSKTLANARPVGRGLARDSRRRNRRPASGGSRLCRLLALLAVSSLACAESDVRESLGGELPPPPPPPERLSPTAAAVEMVESALEMADSGSRTSRSLTHPSSTHQTPAPSEADAGREAPLEVGKLGAASKKNTRRGEGLPASGGGDAFVQALSPRGSRGFPTAAEFSESFERLSLCAARDAR